MNKVVLIKLAKKQFKKLGEKNIKEKWKNKRHESTEI